MDIFAVQSIIDTIAGGFEQACVDCMHANSYQFKKAVEEQLYSGLDGEGKNLTPDYDTDPYFDRVKWFRWEDGVMYHGAEGYKQWKLKITPPERSQIIGLPPRPENIPNLFIDGTFYSTIEAKGTTDGVEIGTGTETGNKIEQKYGSQIFGLEDRSKDWFAEAFLIPAINNFFQNSGYR